MEIDLSGGFYWGQLNANYRLYTAAISASVAFQLSLVKSAATTGKLYKDGVEITAFSTSGSGLTGALSMSGDMVLGAYYNGNDVDSFTGDMMEVIIFNQTLSDADRLAVEAYLYQKYWGAGLPAFGMMKTVGKVLSEAVVIVGSIIRSIGHSFSEVVTIVSLINNSIGRAFSEVITIVASMNNSIGRVFSEVITIISSLSNQAGKILSEVLTINGVATQTAAISPGTTVDDTVNRSASWVAWTNPNNTQVSDGVFATAGLGFNHAKTDYLKATNFGFSIPADAVINGVLVEAQSKLSAGLGYWVQVSLVKAGTMAGSILSGDANAVTTTLSYSSIPSSGASTNLWGNTLTPSDINDSGFGVEISLLNDSTSATASFDHVRITVYYTTSLTVSKVASKVLDEIVVIVDSLVKLPGKILAEVVTLVDTISAQAAKFVTLSEIIVVVDSILRAVGRTFSEVVTLVSTMNRVIGHAFSEVITLVDSVIRTPGKVLAEVFIIVSSINSAIGRTFSEVVTVVDSISRQLGKVFSETVIVVDTFSRTISRTFSEIITVVASTVRSVGRALLEVVVINDIFNATKIAVLTIENEVITVVDSVASIPAKIFSEVVTVVSSFLTQSVFQRTLTEVVIITGTVTKQIGRIFNETIVVTATFFRTISKMFSEVITVIGSLIRDIGRVLSETITIVDSLIKQVGRMFTETVVLTDSLIKTVGKALNESLTIVSSFAKALGASRILSETIVITDSISRSIGKTFNEGITVVASTFRIVSKVFLESVIITGIIGFFKQGRGFIRGLNKDTGTGIGTRNSSVGIGKDTSLGVGTRNKPIMGRNKDTNTGIGTRLD